MRIGIFADTHDHVVSIRLAVERFNAERVDLVLFAGDLVSTIAVPPLRKLRAPLVGCFGDNEGNKIGLQTGFRLVGQLSDPPVRLTTDDGTRFVLAHMKRQLRNLNEEFDFAIAPAVERRIGGVYRGPRKPLCRKEHSRRRDACPASFVNN